MGIKHAVTVADGTKSDPTTQWNADHIIDGTVTPNADALYDLGSATKRMSYVYTQGIQELSTIEPGSSEKWFIDSSTAAPRALFENLNLTTFALRPNTDNTGQLGDSTHYWNDIFGYAAWLKPLAAEPADKAEGMIVSANRVNWDPASKGAGGSYLVYYDGTAWHAFW